jgi:hypothetical protein
MAVLGGVILLVAAGLLYQLRSKPPAERAPAVDAAVAAPPPPQTQPAAAERPRAPGKAASRPSVARTQWPTDVPAGAAKPPMGGFDKWTGDEFYRPDELAQAAKERGVGLDLFRESKRAFWLTQLTVDWGVLEEMGLSKERAVREQLSKLSSTTLLETERLVTAASKGELSEAEARTRIRQLEDDYRKRFCEASGMERPAMDRFFEPSLVPEP